MRCHLNLALRLAAVFAAATLLPLRAGATDDRIVQAAQDSYNFRTYLKDDQIRIAAKGGAVTLTGQVLDEFHRVLAEETLAGLPGVRGVNNQLSLRAVAGGPQPDTTVKARVRTALLLHRDLGGVKAEVTVAKGVVTLRGTAASRAQRERVTAFVVDLDGVAAVVNQLTVAPEDRKARTLQKRIDDASLTAQVKLALLFNRFTSALRTRVRTENGVVFLAGPARSQAEKDQARRVVLSVEGVRSVRNGLIVQPG